jgi:tetratricopeptide (TPR) repeat protein
MQRHLIWQHLRGDMPMDAQRVLEEQHRVVLQSFGANSAEYANVLSFEGIVAWERVDLAAARRYFAEALQVLRASVGNEDALVAGYAHNLADVLLEQGDASAALALYQEALALRQRLQPDGHQTLIVNRLQIARAQCLLGEYEQGIAGFESARAALAARMGATHPALVVAAATHADCLWRNGRVAQARKLIATQVTLDPSIKISGMDRSRIERIVKMIGSEK